MHGHTGEAGSEHVETCRSELPPGTAAAAAARRKRLTHVIGVNNQLDDVAGVGRQCADGRFRNEIFQLLKQMHRQAVRRGWVSRR